MTEFLDWPLRSLSMCVTTVKDKIEPSDAGDLPYIGLEHIERDTGVLLGLGSPSDVRSTKTLFRAGDILYGKLRPYLNKVLIAPFDGVCSTDILAFRANDGVSAKFILHRLRMSDFVSYASAHSKGVNLPRVSPKTVGEFKLSVPPLEDQEVIVARIEELMSDVQAGEGDCIRASDMLPALVDAALLVAFERAAASGPSVRLGDILKTTSGGTPDRKYAANYGGDIPWVKSGELNDSRVVRTEETITESGLATSSAKWVPAGSVLIAMYGATVGVLAHLDIPATTNQAVCAIHPDERVDADYLYWFLRSRRRHLIGLGKGGAQNNIGQGTIRDLVMPLPDRRVQEAIAASVSDTMDAVDILSRDASGIGRGIAGLRQAILKSAFSGQLI